MSFNMQDRLTIKAVDVRIFFANKQTVRDHPVYKQNYGKGWAHFALFYLFCMWSRSEERK